MRIWVLDELIREQDPGVKGYSTKGLGPAAEPSGPSKHDTIIPGDLISFDDKFKPVFDKMWVLISWFYLLLRIFCSRFRNTVISRKLGQIDDMLREQPNLKIT